MICEYHKLDINCKNSNQPIRFEGQHTKQNHGDRSPRCTHLQYGILNITELSAYHLCVIFSCNNTVFWSIIIIIIIEGPTS